MASLLLVSHLTRSHAEPQASDALRTGLFPPRALYVVYPLIDYNDPQIPWTPISEYDTFVSRLSEKEQAELRSVEEGPNGTGFSLKGKFDRLVQPRRRWHDNVSLFMTSVDPQLENNGMLLPFFTGCETRPCPTERNVITQLSADSPPTVLIKALNDRSIDPKQTQMAYDRLKELGVDALILEAEGMEQGDCEERSLRLARWGRTSASGWWKSCYQPALDFCIARCEA